ncbi:hypothetical protein K505DRAFT_70496 [Melanomma pulvis-pyrius CBS 109.77]|uniref:Pentapeptide repeat-containing protein n=1 Tax=Melanomma pulvis-pyrius CBS 109.77 TaxID=1314802 RepID=A0A6A6XWT9_9PLEO|nr:hypothetical protein K505DRAFT_70496 [Melanomma pulvis-pyrius CBS 109.77]
MTLNASACIYQPRRRSSPLIAGIAHPATIDIREWVKSLIRPSITLVEHNWIEGPFEKRDSPLEWLRTKGESEIELFYLVAMGMFLQDEGFRGRAEITKALAKTPPDELWTILSSHSTWSWEHRDWLNLWDTVLQKTAWIFNGYSVAGFPTQIPTLPDQTGKVDVNWDIPYRCYFKTKDARVDGFNATFERLRFWELKSTDCLIANSTWNGVTVTNCKFHRCTFRNTTFENVHLLGCRFTDIDFCDVVIRNSLIANTTLSETQIRNSTLEIVSWCNNSFMQCILEGVRSDKSNWTYIIYTGIIVENHTDMEKSENFVQMSNVATC